MKDKVLITGCAGFLGKNVTQICIEKGYDVIGIDRNAQIYNNLYCRYYKSSMEDVNWEEVLGRDNPKYVFHLAATSSVAASISDPYAEFSKVMPSATRMINELHKISPQSVLVYFSSAAVYGDPKNLPINELTEEVPISPYGLQKYVTERLIYGSGARMGVRAICLRIFSAYGPGLKKQVFFEIERKARLAKFNGKSEIFLNGTGYESRDFIHGEDVALAAITAAENSGNDLFSIINVASGVETTISDAAKMYLSCANHDLEVVFDGVVRGGDPKNWRADIGRLLKIGYIGKYDLKNGLKTYSNWMEGFKFEG